MGLDHELVEMMHDEVVLTPKSSTDRFNNIVFGEPLSDGLASPGHVKCYIAYENKRVLDVQGRETTSTVQIFLADPTLAIDVDTMLELPDGTKPAILGVLKSKDEVGDPYHLEVRA